MTGPLGGLSKTDREYRRNRTEYLNTFDDFCFNQVLRIHQLANDLADRQRWRRNGLNGTHPLFIEDPNDARDRMKDYIVTETRNALGSVKKYRIPEEQS